MTPRQASIVLEDCIGKKFGYWTVLGAGDRNKWGRERWVCRCDCGKDALVIRVNLLCGGSTNCGCVARARLIAMRTKHGYSANSSTGLKARTYRIWQAMLTRCRNSNILDWKNYGGRGITVCDAWKDFTNFLRDMGECPPDRSIDRFPNKNGNYEPGNTRWATPEEQAANRRERRGGNCKRGHPIVGENIMVTTLGKCCRICAREADKIRHRRYRLEKKHNAQS